MKRLILIASLAFGIAWAKQPAPAPPAGESSTKNMDFEGEVVEGVAKQPLDSLNQIAEGEDRTKTQHLYRRREHFKSENAETIRRLMETY